MTKIVTTLMGFLSAESIANIIATLVTKALSKISDKEKLAKISTACGAAGTAVTVTSDAVKDGEITAEEVDTVSDAIKTAVTAIVEAAR